MNKYQRQRSKEIKQIMSRDIFGRITYNMAKREWKHIKRLALTDPSPCNQCIDEMCTRPRAIAYCKYDK